MGWLQKTKQLTTAKRWYCRQCGKRKPIEYNPDWLADGKPFEWDSQVKNYEWFSRCACCHTRFWGSGGYDCPNCGYFDNGEPLKMTKAVLNSYYSYEFGVTGYDWEELHQCPKCRTKYWYSNSTC